MLITPSLGLAHGLHTDLWVDRTHYPLLQIPRRHCWVYDPLFSQLEIAVLKSLGVTVLSENEVSLGEGEQEGCVTADHRCV